MSAFKSFEEFVNEGVSGSSRNVPRVTSSWGFPDADEADAVVEKMRVDGVKFSVRAEGSGAKVFVDVSEVYRNFEERYGLTVGK